MSKQKSKSKRQVSKRRTVTKKVNKQGYYNKYGTKVGPYDRKVKCFPSTYFTYRMVNGEQRLVKITRRNGKEYMHVVEDRRKAKPITFTEAKKHFEKLPEHRQEADKRYRAKNTFEKDEVTSSYTTKTGTSRYDIEELDTPGGSQNPKTDEEIVKTLEAAGGKHWQKYGKNRVYFHAEPLAKLLGYEWDTYKTGNISYAERHGEKISNSEMKRVLSDLNCNLYYDVDDGSFHYLTGIGSGKEHTKEAIEVLQKEI